MIRSGDTTPRIIRKLLVANRGEIALRVFQTCRELGIRTVAVHSEADAHAPHRFGADEAVEIGAAPASESYLCSDRIIDAARATGADAIHPGYGFLSENAAFAEAVEREGITFVGPKPENIRDMGDKVRARSLMQSAGVPVVPGSDEPIDDLETLRSVAGRIGTPLLVKAAGGGGGKGIRRVDSVQELPEAFERAVSEARAAFGDPRVYVERFVATARHVEAQIFGDGQGEANFYGERECSLQRNHQKLLEESPAPCIDSELRERIRGAALAGARALSYRGAGTFEFLFDESRGKFYFLEMNTRLQVEHAVTEFVVRRDLVAEQLRIAQGGTLAGATDPVPAGHAIEFRVYAEDPYRGFAPSVGRVSALRLPHAPFTRIDHGLRDHYEVSPHYDPMLAKLIAWGEDREVAIRRLQSLMERTRISGIHTTIPLGLDICRWPAFQSADFDTESLQHWLEMRPRIPEQSPELAVVLAAIVGRHDLTGRANDSAQRAAESTTAPPASRWQQVSRFEATGRSH